MRVLWILALVASTAAAREVDAREWRRVKRLLPAYLWQPKEKKRAKAAATWKEKGYDDVRLTRAQYKELGRLLRAGSPYTERKRRSHSFEVSGSPVRAIITTKYKPGCGKSFPLIISMHAKN